MIAPDMVATLTQSSGKRVLSFEQWMEKLVSQPPVLCQDTVMRRCVSLSLSLSPIPISLSLSPSPPIPISLSPHPPSPSPLPSPPPFIPLLRRYPKITHIRAPPPPWFPLHSLLTTASTTSSIVSCCRSGVQTPVSQVPHVAAEL